MSVFCQYATHLISESCMQVIESIVARSMDCISLSVNCTKCLLRDPSVVARSIDWYANDRSIVRAEQSMDSANRSTARNMQMQNALTYVLSFLRLRDCEPTL